MSMEDWPHVDVKIILQFYLFYFLLRRELLILICPDVINLFWLYCNGGPYNYFWQYQINMLITDFRGIKSIYDFFFSRIWIYMKTL